MFLSSHKCFCSVFHKIYSVSLNTPTPIFTLLIKVVKVESNEKFPKLTFVSQISHNVKHEARVVPKAQTDLLYFVFGLVIAHNTHPVRFDHKVQLEDKLENLVQSDQESIIWSSQEASFENFVEIGIVQLD